MPEESCCFAKNLFEHGTTNVIHAGIRELQMVLPKLDIERSIEQSMPTDQSAKPKPKLRWYQFSLRSLFLLTFAVAVVSSWIGYQRRLPCNQYTPTRTSTPTRR